MYVNVMYRSPQSRKAHKSSDGNSIAVNFTDISEIW